GVPPLDEGAEARVVLRRERSLRVREQLLLRHAQREREEHVRVERRGRRIRTAAKAGERGCTRLAPRAHVRRLRADRRAAPPPGGSPEASEARRRAAGRRRRAEASAT